MGKYILFTAALLLGCLVSVASGQCVNGSCSSGQCRPSQPQWQVAPPRATPGKNWKLPDAVRNTRNGVVRIANRAGRYIYWGSGVHIGNGVVATCDHIFRRENSTNVGSITVTFYDGSTATAEVIQQNYEWDFALIRLASVPSNAATIQLATVPPRRGDMVYGLGYGPDGILKANQGSVSSFELGKLGKPGISDTMFATGGNYPARDGDSGGPIFNAAGRLVGVVWGVRPRSFVGTRVCRIRLLCRAWLGRVVCPPPSTNTPPVVIVPPPVVTPPASCTDCLEQVADLREEIAVLRRQLGEVALLEPAPGPPGPQGAPGLNGLDAAPVDVEAIVSRIKEELDISVQIVPYNPAG